MANRRMIAKDVTRSDAYLDLPFSSQSLYTQLLLEADDDGFINNCNSIKRLIGASDEDLKTLIDNNFVIAFDSGIIAITHWLVSNSVRKDRYHTTTYQTEFNQLDINKNNEYVFKINLDNQAETTCQPNDNQAETEYKLSKDNLSEDNLSKSNISEIRQGQGSLRGQQSTVEMDDELFRAQFNNK